MTDKDRDELDQLSAEERAKRLARKDAFQLDNEHMRLITQDLFPDDDAGNIKLAKVIRDLVAFCVDGTADLTENIDDKDPADKVARKLLYDDARRFTNAWLLRSLHASQSRQGKTKDKASESQDAEPDDAGNASRPSESDVLDLAHMPEYLGGNNLSDDEVDQIARNFYASQNQNGWKDERGEHVRDWRKLLQRYCQRALKKRVTERATHGR